MDVDYDGRWCGGEGLREQDVEGNWLRVDGFVGGGGYAEGRVDFRVHFASLVFEMRRYMAFAELKVEWFRKLSFVLVSRADGAVAGCRLDFRLRTDAGENSFDSAGLIQKSEAIR